MAAPIRRAQLSEDVPTGASYNPVRLATTLTDALTGLAARDGVTPTAGDRVLVKNQGTGSQNGIYVAAAGAWARATDFDEDGDVDPGALIAVAEGTVNGATCWQMTTPAPISLGATVLTFAIIATAGVDPGAHGTDHDPDGSDPPTIAAPVGLTANSTNASGAADSYTRSSHTHAIDVANGTNSTVNAGDAASNGTATGLSRKDHQHPVATGGATHTIVPDDAAAEGTSSSLAREDHAHPIATAAGATGIGAGNAEGTGNNFARANHDHALRESGGQDLTLAAIAVGDLVERVGTTLVGTASIDGTQHGTQAGGTLHSVAVAAVSNGFISAADQAKLDAIIDPRFRDFKESVRAMTQGDITLSGEQTIDGVLTSADRVGVFSQTVGAENGVYVSAAGAWARASDWTVGDGAAGFFFAVTEGTADDDTTWLVTNDIGSDVIATDELLVTQIGAGSPRGAGDGLVLSVNDLDVGANADGSIVVNADDIQVGVLATDAQHGARGGGTQHADAVAAGASGFMTGADKTKLNGVAAGATANVPRQERVTTESIINSDTALSDTLNNTPISNASVTLFLNGVHQIQGAGEDYTISGATITWLASTGTAANLKTLDDLVATYDSAA